MKKHCNNYYILPALVETVNYSDERIVLYVCRPKKRYKRGADHVEQGTTLYIP